MTLQLSGFAAACTGFSSDSNRSVVRLRSSDTQPNQSRFDFAIARTLEQLDRAKAAGWKSVVLIGMEEKLSERSAEFGRAILLTSPFEYLSDGDIIGVHPGSKRFRTLFRKNSKHNSFLVTERCNNYCLMCSQPPKDVDDDWILDEIKEGLPLVDATTRTLTFTGGEPLTNWRGFIDVLMQCRVHLPQTALQVLTNGRAFSDTAVVDAWRGVEHPNLIAAIPVYSAVDHIHDHVVQAKGAFDETILGILKLKDRGQRVEIRVVLHALTAPRVLETCRWIARNLPFVDHVALMGLENTGFAIANDALLWIDPMDYREVLAEGVHTLNAANVNVSVYNLQRCVLDQSIWTHAVQSISDWKKAYLDQCEACSEKSNCSGFFSTGRPRYSRGIDAIL
jgi:His-Xaa-Ser system radical SAM maturase HxsC